MRLLRDWLRNRRRRNKWAYRVVQRYGPDAPLEICEVFFDERGNIYGWADNLPVSSNDMGGLADTLASMTEALSEPVLIEDAEEGLREA